MFARRYFADRYFAPRYWPKVGLTPVPDAPKHSIFRTDQTPGGGGVFRLNQSGGSCDTFRGSTSGRSKLYR